MEVDVAVCGSGIGGLTAAIVAHDERLNVVLVEKSKFLGGTSAYSWGMVWAPNNHVQRTAGIEDSSEKGAEYLNYVNAGAYPIDRGAQAAFLKFSVEAIEYLQKNAGIEWQIIPISDYYYPSTPGSLGPGRTLEVKPIPTKTLGEWASKVLTSPHAMYFLTIKELAKMGGAGAVKEFDYDLIEERVREGVWATGTGLLAYMVRAAAVDRKIAIFRNTPVTKIITEEGAVSGISVKKDGKDFHIRARKGVILCIGGVDWHKEFPAYFESSPEWNSMVPPSVEGDNVVLAGQVGAVILPVRAMYPHPGIHIPGEEHFEKKLYRWLSVEPALPHAIIVNSKGKRFCDESFYKTIGVRICTFDPENAVFPNWPCYLIFDQNYTEKYPLGSIEPGKPIPEGLARKAETIRDLAEKLGIDPSGLAETISHFNGYAINGKDEDYHRGERGVSKVMHGDLRHKPNPNLGPIERAPFYGIKLSLVGVGQGAGFRINAEAQVIGADGNIIPGLYASGNCTALVEIGTAVVGGIGLSRAMTFGYIAAKQIANRT
jgi:3-oxosteroid 1-dehydrogenase